MELLREYGVAVHVYIPVIKRAVVDFAVGADWTPVAGDVKISKDGGAAANVATLPVAIVMGNGAMWDFALSATEMQAAQVNVTVVDAATKAVEDQMFMISTYGNASARHKVNLNDSVRAGLTALPNAAAEAAGGLYTRGAGAGQINQPANGQVDANTVKVSGTVQTAGDLKASMNTLQADTDDIQTRLPAALVGGRMDSSVGALAAAVITAASIAAAALNGKGDWSTYAGGDTSGVTTLLARLSAARALLLDNLDAAISSRSTYAGGAVASVTANVNADVKKINGTTVNGNGSPATPWGP